ncbi:hypothetical protein D3C80_1218490 [compost metagenome]
MAHVADGLHRVGHPAENATGQLHLLHAPLAAASAAFDGLHRADRALLHGGDNGVDLRRGLGGALRQIAYFVGHHGETAAAFPSPGGLDGGIQRQQVGLLGDAMDNLQHCADLPAIDFQSVDDRGGAGDLVAHGVDARDHAHHGLLAPLGGVLCIVGGARGPSGSAGNLLRRRGHLFHGGGHLIGAQVLVLDALADTGRDGAQFVAGVVQLPGALPQAREGIRKPIVEGIGSGGQAPQFVAAAQANSRVEPPLAELLDIVGQVPQRAGQLLLDQPATE